MPSSFLGIAGWSEQIGSDLTAIPSSGNALTPTGYPVLYEALVHMGEEQQRERHYRVRPHSTSLEAAM